MTNLNKFFLVVGSVRNCEKYLRRDILRIKNALAEAKDIYWMIIESDSTDQSISVLTGLKNEIKNFNYISLGDLRYKIPIRTERIAYCRNIYLDQIRHNANYENVEYIIVSDFDGMNEYLTSSSLESCWDRFDWDVCTANQRGAYYDLWALRHNEWSPNDCFKQYQYYIKLGVSAAKAYYVSVYARMIKIPSSSEWIEVNSSFGGLAVYKKNSILNAKYVGLTDSNEEICEHVTFHQQLKSNGFRIFINPKLINTKHCEHTYKVILTFFMLLIFGQKAYKKLIDLRAIFQGGVK